MGDLSFHLFWIFVSIAKPFFNPTDAVHFFKYINPIWSCISLIFGIPMQMPLPLYVVAWLGAINIFVMTFSLFQVYDLIKFKDVASYTIQLTLPNRNYYDISYEWCYEWYIIYVLCFINNHISTFICVVKKNVITICKLKLYVCFPFIWFFCILSTLKSNFLIFEHKCRFSLLTPLFVLHNKGIARNITIDVFKFEAEDSMH